MNNNKKEQIKRIKNGKGMQYIIEEAYKILGNPILAHDMDYKVIACTENTATDDPIFNEFKANGILGRDRLIFYRDECFFEMVANAKKITLLFSDQLKYNRIFGKLFTKNNIQIGCVCFIACYKPLEKDDSELFEMVCDIINKELYEIEFYQKYGQEYMETLIGKMIEDKLEDKELYVAHIESIYTGLKRNLYLIVADITQCGGSCDNIIYFRNLFNEMMPNFKHIIYSNYILIFVNTNDTIFHIKKELNKLYNFFKDNNIYAGISSCFQNLLELKKYYKQAINALNYGINNNRKQNIYEYDNFRLYYFLNSVKNNTNIWEICHPTTLLIQEYDRKNGTSYIDVLNTYLGFGGNSQLASERMRMSHDKFCVQLKEVTEMFGIDLNNGDMRLSIFISLKLFEYFTH